MESKIKELLDAKVRPMIALHRGEIEFVSYQDKVVTVRLSGTCKGCPLSELTLKGGVEVILRDEIPEIKEVIAIS